MAISKLILNGEVQMDVTSNTNAANNMLNGVVGIKNDGTTVTGSITTKTSSDLTVSGATVTAPAGYYANAASKAVSTTTHPNPTAAITSSTGVVTASHTQDTGYVTGGTTTETLSLTTQAGKIVTPTETAQTAVASYRWTTGPISVAAISSTYVGTGVTTRSAADITKSTNEITAPMGYYSQSATYTVPTYSHTSPSIGFTSSTGIIEATHTAKDVMQNWGMLTGYTTTSSEYALTTQAGQTFYPSTTDQTILRYRWLTGSQIIASVTTSNLTAANIAEGVTVQVGDIDNASRITQVTGTHSGATSYTATISGSGNSGYCYITYKGVKYYTNGDTFTFNEGDTLYISCRGLRAGGTIIINGETVVSDSNYSVTYTMPLPAHDINISITYGSFGTINVSGGETISITTNGTYNVDPYGIANVDVTTDSGGGFTADQIATRTISGDISGNATSIGSYAFYQCTSLNTVSFPLCTSIGNYAFNSCYSLNTISFPSCTYIGFSAFACCSSLTMASFPLCATISSYAFASCSNLTTANFSLCISIGNSAFGWCYSLNTISFPSCTYIGNYAFRSCGLITVNFPRCSIISSYAFAYCSRITTVSFPLCRSIYTYAFVDCSGLTTVNFPSCTSIGGSAFIRCGNLTTASFPSCTTIYGSAFNGCYNLLSLYLLGSSVPSLVYSTAFDSTPIAGYTTSTGGVYGSIFVPSSLYDSYLTATNWSLYSARIVSV